MRFEYLKDLHHWRLAITSQEKLYDEFVKFNKDECDLALHYQLPLNEVMQKLCGTDWYLPELSYDQKLLWLQNNRTDRIQQYLEQILELHRQLIGNREYANRTAAIADLFRNGRSSEIINRSSNLIQTPLGIETRSRRLQTERIRAFQPHPNPTRD